MSTRESQEPGGSGKAQVSDKTVRNLSMEALIKIGTGLANMSAEELEKVVPKKKRAGGSVSP